MARGNFEGERGAPLSSIGTLCGHLCKNGCTDRDAVLIVGSGGSKNDVLDEVQIPPWEGAIFGERGAHGTV